MTDVIVIGGGPAGSAAAIRLSQIGMKVRLYEKSRFPRPKLCGGFLSPESLMDLEQIGVLDRLYSQSAVPIRRTLVSSPSGARAEVSLPGTGLSLSRDILDTLLLQRARDVGVEVQEGTDGFNQTSDGLWTIVATGRKGEPGRYYGIQSNFENVDGITDQVELDLIPGGYVGFVRQGDCVNLCALTEQQNLRDGGLGLDAVLAAWTHQNPLLASRLQNARRITAWQAVGPVRMGLRQLSEPRRLFVGDAACVVDPFAGEGIAMGLRAATLLQKAFQGNGPVENTYARAWHAEFDKALRLGSQLRNLILRSTLQDIVVGGLQMFPAALGWLTERTRPSLYENFESHPDRSAV